MAVLISVRHDASGRACVNVTGDVDLATVGQLDHDIRMVVESEQTTSVCIDLSKLAFLDSSGIASLLRGRRLADAAGKPYRIAGATPIVREVLDVTGVWAYLCSISD